MATILAPARQADLNPAAWLASFTAAGGGYALTADRRLTFIVDQCDAADLATVMGELTGHPDRQEAVKRAIEQRQNGEAR